VSDNPKSYRAETEVSRRLVAARSPWGLVVVPAAIALGAIGSIAAKRFGMPAPVGAVAGALAATLAVLALPSLPTKRVTVLLLGAGGLGALRHAAFPGADRGLTLLVWAAATLVALLLVDRADAESTPLLSGGTPFAGRMTEAARVAGTVGVLVVIAAVALVPSVTDRLARHVWPGEAPGPADVFDAPSSLSSSTELDMTTRPRLSDEVVFTVDAPRADFWRGETFDTWNGHSWTRSRGRRTFLARRGETVQMMLEPLDIGAHEGEEMRQTFRIEASFSNVVFAAPSPVRVETDKILEGRPDGSAIVSHGEFGGGFGRGAVYTVTSRSLLPTAEVLRAADTRQVPNAILEQYTQLSATTTDRVRVLASEVTAGQPTTYDKIRALEEWLGANTRYSLDAPLSPQGVDVVDDFLFRTRLGWCEQVASSLVVLARSAGIPARLVTGFVPGERNHLTGRFLVRERDAHAWAEVYFPGVGWQGFDPTASVPLAGDAGTGGSWLDWARRHAVELVLLASVVALGVVGVRHLVEMARDRRTRRDAPWSTRVMRDLERAGGRAGRPRAAAETPREYAQALSGVFDDRRLAWVGDTLDEDAYSTAGAPPHARTATESVLSSLRLPQDRGKSSGKQEFDQKSSDRRARTTVKGIP
jgi:transglutaminase-like putative cysteine protease